MHLSDHFLFLHLPKTGGWTVRRILAQAQVPHTDLHLNQHAALHQIPERFREGRQIIATVREPCAWYRSYFHYNVRRDGTMSPFVERLMDGKPFELKRALHAMLFPDPDGAPMQMLGIEQRVSPRLLHERHIGPYSWMVAHQLGAKPNAGYPVPNVWLLETGRLRDGLRVATGRLGIELGEALERVPNDNCNADLIAQGKALIPYERPLTEDFDDEMIGWVYGRDHSVVQLMGYRGPGVEPKTSCLIPTANPDTRVADRIGKLLELKDGWYDGEGKALDHELLHRVQEVLDLIERMDTIGNLSKPYIYPSIDGTVNLEWDGYRPACSALLDFGADNEIDGCVLSDDGRKDLTLPLEMPNDQIAAHIHAWLKTIDPGVSS